MSGLRFSAATELAGLVSQRTHSVNTVALRTGRTHQRALSFWIDGLDRYRHLRSPPRTMAGSPEGTAEAVGQASALAQFPSDGI
jgi:hypothetical protein